MKLLALKLHVTIALPNWCLLTLSINQEKYNVTNIEKLDAVPTSPHTISIPGQSPGGGGGGEAAILKDMRFNATVDKLVSW